MLAPTKRPGLPLLHNFLEFQADPLGFWQAVGEMGALVRVQLGPARPFWVVTDADLFQYILQTNARNFPRDRQLRERNGLDPLVTVFNAPTYEEWLWRRRLLQPAFHRKQLLKFADEMVAEAVALIERTDTAAPIELVSLMKALTMRIICRTMFSASLEETQALQHDFEQVTKFSYAEMTRMVPLPLWLSRPEVVRTRRALARRREIIGRIVQERLTAGEGKDDLLDTLIAATLEESGRKFTDDDLIAEMISIVFAGHETTAMTLAWLFYTLTQMPEVAARVQAEVDALGGRAPTLADLDAMAYTHWAIQETLRLYPSVYVTLREAEADDELGGYHVPAGTQFILNIRGLHRDGRYWADPDRFLPERFRAEASAERHKGAFQPFISGPKKCIGDAFAMLEMRLVVPTILQRWRFRYAGERPMQEKAGFVMEAEGDMMMRVGLY